MTSRRIVVDVRAMQSASSADRGIGRYTLDCFQAMEEFHPDLVSYYAFDPAMPVHANLGALDTSGKLRSNDHPDLVRGGHAVYHIASPWEVVSVEQLLPSWLAPGATSVVATVFDLIPMIFPEVYLTDRHVAAGYTVRANALVAMDRLVTISDTTAADVVRELGMPSQRVVPIYGGVASMFTPPSEPLDEIRARIAPVFPAVGSSQFVLAPLGIEPRKNIDRLLHAYAGLDAGLRADHPLVIQCAAHDEDVRRITRQADALGCGGQVHFTGFVSDADLVRLYQAAHLVVFPSIYEGLGLPVLEALSCGAPVICGDNSSLCEIVPDERARFDALDVEAIGGSIDRALRDDALRSELAPCSVPEQFEWRSVADALAQVYRDLLDRPRPARRRRRRLAISSPVPPDRSGPAVYMDHLLGEVAEHCDVTLLTPEAPEAVAVCPGIRVERLDDLPSIELIDGRFDEVLYVMGNSEAHIAQSNFLRRRPGAVLLHDARLVGMYREMAQWDPQKLPDPAGLVSTLRAMYPGRYDKSLSSLESLTNEDVQRLGILMVADVARSATTLLVHSDHAADMVERDCGRRPQVAFPHPFPELSGDRAAEDDLIVSFGVLSPVKGTDTLVEAMSLLDPHVRLALVGHVDALYRQELGARIERLGLSERVELTGSVDRQDYLSWLRRASVAVQLRTTSNGESSGALAETLAAGVPTIVSNCGTFRGLPDDIVVKLPTRSGPAETAAAVAALLASPTDRARRIERGRLHAQENDYPSAARRLVEALFSN